MGMGSHDLRESNDFAWPRVIFWFRIGMATFAIVLLASVLYGLYQVITGPGLSQAQIVGAGLIVVILGLFLLVGLAGRSAAQELIIDQTGVRLSYRRGRPDFRPWDAPRVTVRGRRTDGASDSVSRGRALWSIYGRFGALSETFIPAAAFSELVDTARNHGLRETEQRGRPGWYFYVITR
jgi:hypothetical protein